MPLYRKKRSGRSRKTSGRKPRNLVRTARKRMGYRKRANRPSKTVIPRPLSSDTLFVKLEYSEVRAVFSGITFVKLYYRGNSPWDPYSTGAGGQPRGWDQYAPLYARYLCYGSKITVRFSAEANATADTFTCGIVPALGVNTGLNPDDISGFMERRDRRNKTFVPNGNATCTLSHYASTRKMYGVQYNQMGDSVFSAPTTGNTASEWFWMIGAQCPDGATARQLFVRVSITYYVKFYDRIIPGPS